MQAFTEIQSSQSLQSSLRLLLENDKTALSCSAGSAFPTSNRHVGMLCYRIDQAKLYILKDLNPTWALLLDLSRGDKALAEQVIFGALVRRSSGNDGGALKLERAESGTTLTGNVDIRLKGDRLEIRDSFSGKGFYINLATGVENSGGKIWTEKNHGKDSGLDADLLDGRQSGNAENEIPLNNGRLNEGLNAQFLNGREESYFASRVSPSFEGTPAAPTPPLHSNSTQIATTAFVQQALGTVNLSSRLAKTGDTMTGALTIAAGALYLRGLGGDNNRSAIYLNAANNRYLHFDGSNYVMPGANLYVNGAAVLNRVHAGLHGANIYGNCGDIVLAAGYEAFQSGTGVGVRQVIQNCRNCNCDCDCACGNQ